MGWFDWWTQKKDEIRESAFVNAVEGLLKLVAGSIAGEMWGVAREAVVVAENQGGSGSDKFKNAYENIEEGFKDKALPKMIELFFEQFVSAIIELAVVWLRAYVQKKLD